VGPPPPPELRRLRWAPAVGAPARVEVLPSRIVRLAATECLLGWFEPELPVNVHERRSWGTAPMLHDTYVQSLLPTHKGMHGACALPTTAKWADPHNKRYSILNRDPQQFTLSLRKDLPRRIDVWWVYWDLQTGLWKKQILRIMTSRPCFSSSVAAVASGGARNYR
jgi:hypothetical protein